MFHPARAEMAGPPSTLSEKSQKSASCRRARSDGTISTALFCKRPCILVFSSLWGKGVLCYLISCMSAAICTISEGSVLQQPPKHTAPMDFHLEMKFSQPGPETG